MTPVGRVIVYFFISIIVPVRGNFSTKFVCMQILLYLCRLKHTSGIVGGSHVLPYVPVQGDLCPCQWALRHNIKAFIDACSGFMKLRNFQ